MTTQTIPAFVNPDYDYLHEEKHLKRLRSTCEELMNEKRLGVDTETSGLDCHADHVELIQVSTPTYCLIVDLANFRDEDGNVRWDLPGLKQLKQLLESKIAKIVQNGQFDLNMLRGDGVRLGGNLFDTMMAARIYNVGTGAKNDLGSIIRRELNVEIDKSNQTEDWTQRPLPEDMLKYAAIDSVCLHYLVEPLAKKLTTSKSPQGRYLSDITPFECALLRAISEMGWQGMGFNLEKAKKLDESLAIARDARRDALVEALDKAITDKGLPGLPRHADGTFNLNPKTKGSVRLGTKVFAGFNPDSSKQMAAALDKAGVMLSPSATGNLTVDQNLLRFTAKEMRDAGMDTSLIVNYLEWKKIATRCKHINTLLKAAGERNRICASYRQLGTETGRLSCANPNLQQIPRSADFRSLFEAEKGYKLVVADFSQIELRVAAELSGEPNMVEAYNAGRDLHTETASLMLNKPIPNVTSKERTSAKIANFGLLFGAGAGTLLGQAISQYDVDWSLEDAQEMVDGFRAAYPTLIQWQRKTGEATTGAIFTKLGRRRLTITDRSSKFTTRINTEVQGTAGECAKLSLLKIWEKINTDSDPGEARLIGTCHDEILLEVKEGTEPKWMHILKSVMEEAGSELIHSVPIVADVKSGDTWADCK